MVLRPDKQTLLMLTLGTLIGMPAFAAAWRAGTCPCPAIRTWPISTYSTSSGATPALSSAALIAQPPSSAALAAASAPLSLPIGVRAPATMYDPAITGSRSLCAASSVDSDQGVVLARAL